MKKILFLACVLLYSTLIFSQELTAEQKEIYKEVDVVLQQKMQAALKNDLAAFKEVQHDESVVFVFGTKFSGKDYNKMVGNKMVVWESIKIDEQTPHFFNNNSICILTGKASIKLSKPQPMDLKLNFTDVFTKKDGKWVSIYFHNEEIKPFPSK